MEKWLKTAAAWFGVSFLSVLIAQYAEVGQAVNAGDWDSAKKFGIAALVAAFTAGVGSILTHLTPLVGDPGANVKEK